jgi:hypothetical protein
MDGIGRKHQRRHVNIQLVILRARHNARNNLRADHTAQVQSLLGQLAQDKLGVQSTPTPEQTDNRPLYHCQLHTQALAQPVSMLNLQAASGASSPLGLAGLPDPRLNR